MTTAYDPNANDAPDYNDGTCTAEDSAPAANNSDLAEGTYTARAIQWAWDEKKDGEPCLAFLFELSSGKPGYRLDGRLYLDEAKPDAKGRTALSRTMEVLSAMGLQGPIPADLSTVDLTVGEVSLVVEINEKGYPQVRFVNAPRAPRELRTFATPAPQKVAAFAAKINARIAALGAGQRAAGTTPVAAPAAHSIAHPPAQQRPVARPQPAAQGRPGGNTNARQAPAQQTQQKAPPPRMTGGGANEFTSDADDSIPF